MGGLFLILLLYRLCTAAALQMTGPSTYTASVGSIAQIPCTFITEKFPADPRFFAVYWYLNRKSIISFDNTIISTDPRYSLDEDRALNGNANLIISNVSVSDAGDYECSVTDSPSSLDKYIRVTIIATPNVIILNKVVTKSIKSNLQGIIFGFYPVDIDIKWLQDGEILNNFLVGKPQRNLDGTYSVNSSVTIIPTDEDRERIFSCKVQHESLITPLQQDFRLLFSGQPQLTIPTKIAQRNIENTLTCMVTGFFPPDINVTWYKDGEVLNNQLMGEPHKNDNGTYQVISMVTITPSDDDQNRIFSCRVQHISLQEPLQEDFEIVILRDSSSYNYVIIIFCIVVVILAMIIVIFLWKKKPWRKAFTIMDIEGPTKLITGEETSLHCRATNCPKNVSVTWLRKKDGRECEIPAFMGKDQEEEERLLDTSYDVISHREEPHYTSVLTFRPSVAEHKDVTFICRYSCGKQKKEKTFDCRTIYAKPQMVEPIMITLGESSRVHFTLHLQKFYPKYIDINWKYESRNTTCDMSQKRKSVIENEDLTYDISSVGKCHMNVFNDPNIKVFVTWKHESMEVPETRTLTIRDLPWHPQVKDIIIPKLEEDKKTSLTCDISGYFPDEVTVSWFKKNPKDSHSFVISLKSPDYKVFDYEEELNDNTFHCQSSLTMTPKFSRDQGAEFICRVEHPTLEHPIEKTTGPLTIENSQRSSNTSSNKNDLDVRTEEAKDQCGESSFAEKSDPQPSDQEETHEPNLENQPQQPSEEEDNSDTVKDTDSSSSEMGSSDKEESSKNMEAEDPKKPSPKTEEAAENSSSQTDENIKEDQNPDS